MFSVSLQILLAYFIDLIVGDPRKLPHPVIYMGKAIVLLERIIRKKNLSPKALKVAGVLFPLLIAGGSCFVVWSFLEILNDIHPILAWVIEIWLISTTIATKGLKDAGMEIYHHLKKADLNKGREALSMIVGRDTQQLDKEEVSRGAVETVAENIVDAIISPLFYALIGGAPLAFLYRATNTLDSMVGYKNEKYKDLGFASAKFDDILNYIPARITGMLLIISSFFLKLRVRDSFKIMVRDAKLHPSPNSGFPEATVAGALGIQLGGMNYYQGIPSNRAKMGDYKRAIEEEDILHTIKLMIASSCLFVFISFFITIL